MCLCRDTQEFFAGHVKQDMDDRALLIVISAVTSGKRSCSLCCPSSCFCFSPASPSEAI